MTSFFGSQAAQADDLTPTSVKAGDAAGYLGVLERYNFDVMTGEVRDNGDGDDVHVIRMVGSCWKQMVHGSDPRMPCRDRWSGCCRPARRKELLRWLKEYT